MASAYLNFVILLALVLVPTTSLAQIELGIAVNISGNVACTGDGNPNEAISATGAANATARLMCGNNTIGTAITDNDGHFGIRANLTINVKENSDDVLTSKGGCSVVVDLPVPSCSALNHTGALKADVQPANITSTDHTINVDLRLRRFEVMANM